jgi:opacity protein-like surface antigen
MNRTCAVLLLACSAITPRPLQAQQPPTDGGVAGTALRARTLLLSVEAGGAGFTDFQRSTARRLPGDPELPELEDFRRRISAHTSSTVGAALTYWPTTTWGVRAAIAYTPTGFSVWNEEAARRMLHQRSDSAPAAYRSLDAWTASGTAVFRLPLALGRVAPYGLAGVGRVRYATRGQEQLPPEARDRFGGEHWAAWAAVFGAGASVALQRAGLVLSFELTNHLTRTPLDDEGDGEYFELQGVTLQLDPRPGRGTDGIDTVSNLRLTVGLALPLR